MTNPVETLAESLLEAADAPSTHPRPRIDGRLLELDTGLAIQQHQLSRRLARGERIIGVKLGLTTAEQRQAAGHFRPSAGLLTDAMILRGPLDTRRCVAARVEPEMVFVTAEAIEDPALSDDDIVAALGSVHAGIEVVDPRYPDEAFVLPDAMADNASARFVMWSDHGTPLSALNLSEESVTMTVTGQPSVVGSGREIMGNPIQVVTEVLRDRLERGIATPPGFVIFSGNMAGQALRVRPGDSVEARFDTVGTVSFDVV